jgi:hypothetical protein
VSWPAALIAQKYRPHFQEARLESAETAFYLVQSRKVIVHLLGAERGRHIGQPAAGAERTRCTGATEWLASRFKLNR